MADSNIMVKDDMRGVLKASAILSLIGGILSLAGALFCVIAGICCMIASGQYMYAGDSLKALITGIVLICYTAPSVVMGILNILHFAKVKKSQANGRTTFEFYRVDRKTIPVGFLIANILCAGSAVCIAAGIVNVVAWANAKNNNVVNV